MKYLFLLVLASGLYSQSAAQADTATLRTGWTEKIQRSLEYTRAVADLMPEQDWSFRPTDSEMSFQEQLVHLSLNMFWLSHTYLLEEKNPVTQSREALAKMSKSETLTFVESAYVYAGRALNQISMQSLHDKVDFFAGPKTRYQIIQLLFDHQTHHRAQTLVYLRLKGLKPPRYVGW